VNCPRFTRYRFPSLRWPDALLGIEIDDAVEGDHALLDVPTVPTDNDPRVDADVDWDAFGPTQPKLNDRYVRNDSRRHVGRDGRVRYHEAWPIDVRVHRSPGDRVRNVVCMYRHGSSVSWPG